MLKKRHAKRLENEPVTVFLNGEESYTFRHMDHADLPSKQDAVNVLQMIKSPSDFKNLIPFLRGLHMSNISLSPNRWEYLIRKAAKVDKLSLIIECARQSERTGLTLKDKGIVRRLFFEIHRVAQEANFEGEKASHALGLAKHAVDLMDAPQHAVKDPEQDPKCRPFVIGTLLELSAARALNELGGQDEGSLVLNYAQKLIASWPRGHFQNNVSKPVQIDERLQENLAIYNGIQMTLLVNGIALEKPVYNFFKGRLGQLKDVLKNQLEKCGSEAEQSGYTSNLLGRSLLKI